MSAPHQAWRGRQRSGSKESAGSYGGWAALSFYSQRLRAAAPARVPQASQHSTAQPEGEGGGMQQMYRSKGIISNRCKKGNEMGDRSREQHFARLQLYCLWSGMSSSGHLAGSAPGYQAGGWGRQGGQRHCQCRCECSLLDKHLHALTGPMGMTLGWVSPLRATSTAVKVKRCRRAGGRAGSQAGRVDGRTRQV